MPLMHSAAFPNRRRCFQGLWSIARSDVVHWSREDCDWGGGGQYVGQTGRLAEMLFTLQRPELGWQVRFNPILIQF